jgi:hypothetical protein
MPTVVVALLPADPLAAAQAFHADVLPGVLAAAGGAGALTLLLPPLPHAQQGWMLAALQSLARARAPQRINGVAGAEPARGALAAWLEQAEAITGQLIHADGGAAPEVLD